MTDRAESLPTRSRHARIVAMQAIFVASRDDKPARGMEKNIIKAMQHDDQSLNLDPDYVVLKRILTNYDRSFERIWEIIAGHLPAAWPIKRLDPVVKAILAASLAEALSQKTPAKVILREYTAIADSFSSDKEIDFIHGMVSGMLVKIGYLDKPNEPQPDEPHD